VAAKRVKGRHIKKGWHIKDDAAPHRGKGCATVEPLRRKEDVAAIKEHLSESPRDYAMFTVGINTGLRGSDLIGLRFKDILTPDGQIKSALDVKEQKTSNHRHIALCSKVREALSVLCSNNGNTNRDDFVFPSRKGGKMSIQRLHQLVNEWAKETGINGHFGSHTLRKTFGYFHYKQGTDIAWLMDIFGHSSQRTTLRYIGIQQQGIDEANLRLNL
jgi:integrase